MNFVTSISLIVLGAMFLALLGWGSIRAAWRNCEGRRGVFAALAILAAVCSIVAQKPSPDTPTITVDALLRDVGCYATNDVFHAAVTNAPSYAGVDFSDCDLMVYARERASTDAASWFELTPRKKFSQQPADYAIENATNFNYMVYLNYVPPSPVHTNGVFELYGFVIGNEAQGELDQLAAGFINSRAITIRDLPYDAEVEYLESTGTQYINTGIRVDNTCGYNISFMGLEGNDRIVMGVKGAGDSRWCLSGAFSPNANLSWNTSSGYSGRGLRKIQEARMNYLNDRKRILNGVDVGDITSPLNASAKSYDVCMFAGYWGNATVSLYSVARIYSIQISRGQEIIFDGQPVRVGTTGAIYDKRGVGGMNSDGSPRNDGMYFNRGTGNFGYGNDK